MNFSGDTISVDDLVCMDDGAQAFSYRVEVAYAREDNLLFGERIYRADAKLYLHKDLAGIVRGAAAYCYEKYKIRFVLYDGLRSVEAQEAMMRTRRVLDNPHWLEPPRLLSPPGTGGHPRGMAVDIGLEDIDGRLIDMGCAFDFLAENPNADLNPAHRNYAHPKSILDNRKMLDSAMIWAAEQQGTALVLLPQEWWDFRLEASFFERYKPLYDRDLPAGMKQMP